MNKNLIAFLLCFYLPSALAEASDEHKPSDHSDDFRVLQELGAISGGKAVLMVKEGGHLLGQPYQVEVRGNCSGGSTSQDKWPVKDSFSVCDLSPESVKLNTQKTAVALKTKMAEVSYFDQQIEEGMQHPQMRCLEKTTIKKFSLKNLCP